ncbi:unnamed protein product, partial [Polarella glacialis]
FPDQVAAAEVEGLPLGGLPASQALLLDLEECWRASGSLDDHPRPFSRMMGMHDLGFSRSVSASASAGPSQHPSPSNSSAPLRRSNPPLPDVLIVEPPPFPGASVPLPCAEQTPLRLNVEGPDGSPPWMDMVNHHTAILLLDDDGSKAGGL